MLSFELHGRTPCSVTPLPARCSGDHYPLPLARRDELHPFGSPLRVMPGNILKDRNGGQYPHLTTTGGYTKIFVEEGMAEGFNWDAYYESIIFI